MNHLQLFFALNLISSCMLAQEIRLLQEINIDQKVSAIETQLKREQYMLYGLTALGVAHELYQWVPALKQVLGCHAVAPEQKQFMWEAFKEGMSSLFYTSEGWISIANAGFSMTGFVMVSKLSARLMHPNTLRWYVGAHAPYMLTIQMMKNQSGGLLVCEDNVKHKEFLQALYNRLVVQGESMCAYMKYKSAHLEDEEKIIAQRVTSSLFIAYNNGLKRIYAELISDNESIQYFAEILDAYEADITSYLNYFAIIEGETLQEKSLINKQIKRAMG